MDGDQFKCAMEAEEPSVEALEEIAAEKKRKSEEANARRREQEKREAEEEARQRRETLEEFFNANEIPEDGKPASENTDKENEE